MKEPNRERKNEIKYKVTLNEEQKEAKKLIIDNQIVIITGRAGSGKSLVGAIVALDFLNKKQCDKILVTRSAIEVGRSLGFLPGPQPLWAKVLTPKGWSTIGDLQIGDKVINKKGKSSKIINKSDISYEDIYKITTSDNRATYCSLNHLFYTTTFYNKKQNKEGSIKTLKEIMDTFYDIHNKPNHYLPYNNPTKFSNPTHKTIPPYVMGCLLGDGCFSGSVSVSSSDLEIITKIQNLVSYLDISLVKSGPNYSFSYNNFVGTKVSQPIKITNLSTGVFEVFTEKYKAVEKYDINPSTLDYRCKNKTTVDNLKFEFLELKNKSVNPIKNEIYNLGLLDTRTHNKFIPKSYIYNASIEDRIELLRGLMDTDGSNNKKYATYTTCSPTLRDDVIELVRSLGGKATYTTLNKTGPITINGKRAKSNYITYEIWINIDFNPFYLSRKSLKYNPRFKHEIKITQIEKLDKDYVQCLLLDSEEGLYITDDYIVTHNSLEEKFDPYIEALVENLYKCMDKIKIDEYIKQGKIFALPVQFIRGKTISDILIVEEAQNLTKTEMLAILTRLGKNGKIVINGDNNQTDIKSINGEMNGLSYAIELSKKIEEIKYIKLKENHRSDLVGKILDYEFG